MKKAEAPAFIAIRRTDGSSLAVNTITRVEGETCAGSFNLPQEVLRDAVNRISYYDGLHFANAKHCEQPLTPNCWLLGVKSAGVAKDRSLAANIDADRALISFKEMPIRQVEANHDALKVARGEIGGLAVERATLIDDFEDRQNPALLDIVEFDGFIWEPDRNRGH